MQSDPVAFVYLHREIVHNKAVRALVAEAVFSYINERVFVVNELCEPKIIGLFKILKQTFFLLDLTVDTLFHLLDTALHLLGLCADKRACADAAVVLFYRVIAYLRAFTLVCPVGSALCCLTQFSYLLFVLFVFCKSEAVTALLVFPPACKITRLHLDSPAVEHKNVVYAGIEQITVVRNKYKAFL